MATTPVPDYCEPILAWRLWVVKGAPLPAITGVGMGAGVLWDPYMAFVAEHQTTEYSHPSNRSPHPLGLCDVCGVYGLKDVADLDGLTRGDFPGHVILGRVALWGEVAIHERGYRAQYAYPASFAAATKEKDLAELAAAYGVPIEENEQCQTLVKRSRESLRSPFGPLYLTARSPPLSVTFHGFQIVSANPRWSPSAYFPPNLCRPDDDTFALVTPGRSDEPSLVLGEAGAITPTEAEVWRFGGARSHRILHRPKGWRDTSGRVIHAGAQPVSWNVTEARWRYVV